MNSKFKTAICKHFTQTGVCHMGPKCHFAHGKEELRDFNDPIPQGMTPVMRTPKQNWDFSGQQQQQPGGQSMHSNQSSGGGNYKTAKCKFFEKGYCKYEQNCSFAHGDQDLRSPNSYSTPQGGHAGGMSGANSTGGPSYVSNLQSQVAFKQIQYLGEQLNKYHLNNPDVLERIKKGNEMNLSGNTQGAASVLYGIMSRPDRSEEDNENYAAIIYSTQQMGETLYQKLQTQQFSQMGTQQTGGLNPVDTNQFGGFGAPTGYKQSYGQTQSYGQGHIHKEQTNDEPNFQNEEHTGSYGNPMTGGYQGQGGYGYSNYGGNQGGYGGQYDPQGHY